MLAATVAASVASACPDGLTLMSTFNYTYSTETEQLMACEDISSPNGSIVFFSNTSRRSSSFSPFPLTLPKRVYSNVAVNDSKMMNYSKDEVLAAKTDILGDAILAHAALHSDGDPLLSHVTSAMPPLRSAGSARVWTANRISGRDATFDAAGSNGRQGNPSPQQVSRVLPGFGGGGFTAEGLIGGDLPILLFNFAVKDREINSSNSSSTRFWEMSVVPVANDTGFEQPIYLRFMSVNASAADSAGSITPATVYFDTFAYVPSKCGAQGEGDLPPGSPSLDTLAGCDPPANFYRAVLDVHFFWERTWIEEGRSAFVLPSHPKHAGADDTDGELLLLQAQHALVLDMITRSGQVWPRYGTAPGYDQAGIGADGFQEIFTASMMASLEWGLFGYAREVLDNYLSYFVMPGGGVLYRGLEMAQHGRMLTNIAQYYSYTGDSRLLLAHLDKISGIAWLLNTRRNASIAAYAGNEKNDSRYGMPTGNDEADLFWVTVDDKPQTELPFLSIATEMWRGFRDCGEALSEIAAEAGSDAAARVAESMLVVTGPLLTQIQRSMRMDAMHSSPPGSPRCLPYVAGIRECGMLPQEASDRDSEPWRTYSEALYSGALGAVHLDSSSAPTAHGDPSGISRGVVPELVAWHATEQGSGVKGSRLKLRALSGNGGDVSTGDSFETFTIHGWGYGLLQADLIETYLLQYYALSAHAYTRGTWIAPESTPLDRTHGAPSFATPAGVTAPIFLKWMLLYEEPLSHTLWIGKAVPRTWLSEGDNVGIDSATSAYGRLSFRMTSSISSVNSVTVNVTMDAASKRMPQMLKIRVRVPGKRVLKSVRVGSQQWPESAFNATEETVSVSQTQLSDEKVRGGLQNVVFTFF